MYFFLVVFSIDWINMFLTDGLFVYDSASKNKAICFLEQSLILFREKVLAV
jgi:hypothetical protein